MDDADRAGKLVAQREDIALETVLNTPDRDAGEVQVIENGVVLCIDCHDPIPLARLDKRPESIRCVECKEAWEHERERRR